MSAVAEAQEDNKRERAIDAILAELMISRARAEAFLDALVAAVREETGDGASLDD